MSNPRPQRGEIVIDVAEQITHRRPYFGRIGRACVDDDRAWHHETSRGLYDRRCGLHIAVVDRGFDGVERLAVKSSDLLGGLLGVFIGQCTQRGLDLVVVVDQLRTLFPG